MENTNNLMIKLSEEISVNRAKIIDDFIKTYIATRWQDYFSKQKKIDFRRIELVERRDSPMKTTYFIRLRRGKLPKKSKSEVPKVPDGVGVDDYESPYKKPKQ